MQDIQISTINVRRDSRQRKSISNLDGLKASLKNIGQINPITIDKNNNLVAGERRLTAARELGWETIKAVVITNSSDINTSLMELEENVKREDLHWVDKVEAMCAVRDLMAIDNPEVTTIEVAEHLGLPRTVASKMFTLGDNLSKPGNEDLRHMASWRTAYNTFGRRVSRDADDELESILAGPSPTFGGDDAPTTDDDAPQSDAPPDDTATDQRPRTDAHTPDAPPSTRPAPDTDAPSPAPRRATGPVLAESFLDWAPTYEGERFNFIHCDFPYGIDHDKSDQGGADRWGSYADSEDVFFGLLECLLNNTDNLAAGSAHLMFWFSMKHYAKILHRFETAQESRNPWVVNPTPLVWFKTDNTGILPDANRGPRQIYETALIATRGDRRVVQAVGNCYGSPGRFKGSVHQSHKSEAMLKHFMRMFCDGSTKILDPTAGSGSSLVAAKSFGASNTLGLEVDSEMAKAANRRITEGGSDE